MPESPTGGRAAATAPRPNHSLEGSTQHLTWARIIELEPRLEPVLEVARSVQEHNGWDEWALYDRSKVMASCLIGHGASHPELRTSRAYELFIAHVKDEIGL